MAKNLFTPYYPNAHGHRHFGLRDIRDENIRIFWSRQAKEYFDEHTKGNTRIQRIFEITANLRGVKATEADIRKVEEEWGCDEEIENLRKRTYDIEKKFESWKKLDKIVEYDYNQLHEEYAKITSRIRVIEEKQDKYRCEIHARKIPTPPELRDLEDGQQA